MKKIQVPVFIMGASRGVGMEVARLACGRGYSVHAMTRTYSNELAKIGVCQWSGDAIDRPRIDKVITQIDPVPLVITTMGGGRADGEGSMNLIRSAVECGVRRLLFVSSLGAGDSRAYASELLLAAIGDVLTAKTQAEDLLRSSQLDYTILRPGQLNNGPYSGKATLLEDPSVHGQLSRADLASLLVECLHRPDTYRRVYSAVAFSREKGR